MSDCKTIDEKIKDKFSPYFKTLPTNNIKHIIAVCSGKGGVGKSFTTAMLAVSMMKRGYKVGILDADITGPSVPHAFGIHDKITGTKDSKLIPAESKNGIKIVSINLLLEHEEDAVVWRGPVLANALQQFYSDTMWGDIDYLFVDMPPGTSDVALTVFKNFPISGVIIVSTPQELVHMIVGKAVQMAEMLKLNVIGIIENFAYIKCPHCGEAIYYNGDSTLYDLCNTYHTFPLGSIPFDPEQRNILDKGMVEEANTEEFDDAVESILEIK